MRTEWDNFQLRTQGLVGQEQDPVPDPQSRRRAQVVPGDLDGRHHGGALRAGRRCRSRAPRVPDRRRRLREARRQDRHRPRLAVKDRRMAGSRRSRSTRAPRCAPTRSSTPSVRGSERRSRSSSRRRRACRWGTSATSRRRSTIIDSRIPNIPSYNFPGVTGWAALPVDNRGFRVRGAERAPTVVAATVAAAVLAAANGATAPAASTARTSPARRRRAASRAKPPTQMRPRRRGRGGDGRGGRGGGGRGANGGRWSAVAAAAAGGFGAQRTCRRSSRIPTRAIAGPTHRASTARADSSRTVSRCSRTRRSRRRTRATTSRRRAATSSSTSTRTWSNVWIAGGRQRRGIQVRSQDRRLHVASA